MNAVQFLPISHALCSISFIFFIVRGAAAAPRKRLNCRARGRRMSAVPIPESGCEEKAERGGIDNLQRTDKGGSHRHIQHYERHFRRLRRRRLNIFEIGVGKA